jgi:class 3 adenylate cyclase
LRFHNAAERYQTSTAPEAVQLAGRICARAEAGEILAPIVVRQLAAGKGFLFADRGEVALRGFEDPVRLYELRWREPA